jgi:hypothetical protein
VAGSYLVGDAADDKLAEWGIPGDLATSLREDGSLA